MEVVHVFMYLATACPSPVVLPLLSLPCHGMDNRGRTTGEGQAAANTGRKFTGEGQNSILKGKDKIVFYRGGTKSYLQGKDKKVLYRGGTKDYFTGEGQSLILQGKDKIVFYRGRTKKYFTGEGQNSILQGRDKV